MNFYYKPHIIGILVILSQSSVQSEPIRLVENNKTYPSWYWRLIGGCCCVVEIEILGQNLEEIKIDKIVEEAKSRQPISTTKNIYNGYNVRILSEKYLPVYYQAQNISVRNTAMQNGILKIHETHNDLVDYNLSKLKIGNRIIVLLEPCLELNASALRISHIFTDDEFKLALSLIQKMPKFKESEGGIYWEK